MSDKAAIAEALERLLTVMGLDPARKDFADTPRRVAELWDAEFLSGYEMDPKEILANPIEGEENPDAVFVTDLTFHSMCPHHMLPTRGRAHVAYIPDGRLVGFGRVAQVVACYTQRFTLQERATHQVANALMTFLPARGAGCVMEAEHLCLAIPGDKHQASRVITSTFLGEMKDREDLRSRLMNGAGRSG